MSSDAEDNDEAISIVDLVDGLLSGAVAVELYKTAQKVPPRIAINALTGLLATIYAISVKSGREEAALADIINILKERAQTLLTMRDQLKSENAETTDEQIAQAMVERMHSTMN